MPKTFEAKLRSGMAVMRSKLLSDHFSSRLLFLSISEFTLLISNGIAFEGNAQSLLTVKISCFVNNRDPYSYTCNVK